MEVLKCHLPDCTNQPKHVCLCNGENTLSCTIHIDNHHRMSPNINHYFEFIGSSSDTRDAVAGYLLNEKFKLRRIGMMLEEMFRAGNFEINKKNLLSRFKANTEFVEKFYNDITVEKKKEKPEISALLRLDAQEAVELAKIIISSNDYDQDKKKIEKEIQVLKNRQEDLEKMNSDFQNKMQEGQSSKPSGIFVFLVIIVMLWYWGIKNNDELLKNSIKSTKIPKSPSSAKNFEIIHKENDLGLNLLEEGKYEEALLHFNKSLQLSPNEDIILYNQGITLLALKRITDARNSCKEAIRINPNNGLAQSCIGQIFYYEQNFEKAIEYFDKAINISPNIQDYHILKGSALKILGKNQKAEQCFKTAEKLKNNS